MQLDVKAEDIYQKVGDYSPQTAMEKGLITDEEREYLLKNLREKFRPAGTKPERFMEKELKLEPKAQDIFDRIRISRLSISFCPSSWRRELQAEIAQHERHLRKAGARLLIEEQLRLSLQRVIETNFRTWRVRSNGYALQANENTSHSTAVFRCWKEDTIVNNPRLLPKRG